MPPSEDGADCSQGRRLGLPIYEFLGGKVRNKLKVYAWIGGDRPGDVEAQAYGTATSITLFETEIY